MELDTQAFRLARPGTEGYDRDEVDRFVAQVKTALTHRPPTMAPWEVRDKVFRTQRVHRGYNEHDVDDFLDRAEQALREAHAAELSVPAADGALARRTWRASGVLVVVTLLAAAVAAVLLIR